MANHVTPEEAAERLGLTAHQVQQVILREDLPSVVPGRFCIGLLQNTVVALEALGKLPDPEPERILTAA